MSLRVADLVTNPALRTRVCAGESGLDRTVQWAHTCEDAHPWEWLGNGELVMMSGRQLPTDPSGQAEFIRSLAKAGLVGLALAEGMGAPTLTEAARAVADELEFPVLETAYEVPWVLLARTVAEATSRSGQLTAIMRVYECYRQAAQAGLADLEVLRLLEHEIGAELALFDMPTGQPLIATSEVPTELSDRIHELASHEHLPGITRLGGPGQLRLLIPIGRDREMLVATVGPESLDLVLLQHIGAIVSVLAARSRAEITMRINAGTSFLTPLLDGRLDSELATDKLAELDLIPGPWLVLALTSEVALDPISVLRSISTSSPALVVPTSERVAVLVRESDRAAAIADLTGRISQARIGVSDALRSLTRLPDAVREARWALASAATPVAEYGADRPLFLPRTLHEARAVVGRVLGELLAYDEQNNTNLLESLEVFFDSKRSWQTASRRLQVHKQTLVYRMRRVAEISGRELDSLDDVSELHLALRTRRLLGDFPGRDFPG